MNPVKWCWWPAGTSRERFMWVYSLKGSSWRLFSAFNGQNCSLSSVMVHFMLCFLSTNISFFKSLVYHSNKLLNESSGLKNTGEQWLMPEQPKLFIKLSLQLWCNKQINLLVDLFVTLRLKSGHYFLSESWQRQLTFTLWWMHLKNRCFFF